MKPSQITLNTGRSTILPSYKVHQEVDPEEDEEDEVDIKVMEVWVEV